MKFMIHRSLQLPDKACFVAYVQYSIQQTGISIHSVCWGFVTDPVVHWSRRYCSKVFAFAQYLHLQYLQGCILHLSFPNKISLTLQVSVDWVKCSRSDGEVIFTVHNRWMSKIRRPLNLKTLTSSSPSQTLVHNDPKWWGGIWEIVVNTAADWAECRAPSSWPLWDSFRFSFWAWS